MEIFSKNLRDERKAQGYTQFQMADMIGVSRGTYKGYELIGHTNGREPPFEVVVKIAKVLKVTTDYLFGLED